MISSKGEIFQELTTYVPPDWCKHLKNIPKFRIPLAMKPTPIHSWKIEDVPDGFELSVKRDDMTGSVLTGNKVRKLEFLMADAKFKGHSSVITAGAFSSNHCRATVIAARQLGLACYLLYRDPNEKNLKDETTEECPNGNFMLCKIGQATSFILPWKDFINNIGKNLERAADHILKTTGKSPYIIAAGGSDEVGLHGYLYAWEEMIQQKVLENFDDVVVTTGSTGTAASLCIGNYLTGGKLKIHAVSVSRSSEAIHLEINKMLKRIGIDHIDSKQIVKTYDQYIGDGYNRYTEEDVAFCANIAFTTGIYCDPVYSGKTLKGMINEMKVRPSSFQGKRILFIHTGGIFGMMDSKMARIFHRQDHSNSTYWNEIFPQDDEDTKKCD